MHGFAVIRALSHFLKSHDEGKRRRKSMLKWLFQRQIWRIFISRSRWVFNLFLFMVYEYGGRIDANYFAETVLTILSVWLLNFDDCEEFSSSILRMLEEVRDHKPMIFQLQQEYVVAKWSGTFRDFDQLTADEITALGQCKFSWCMSLFQENRWAEGCPEILHCKLCQYIWLCVSNKAIPKPSIIELAGVSHNLLDHDRRTACTYKNIEYKDINYPCWNCFVCQEMRDKLHIVDHDSCCCHLCCYPCVCLPSCYHVVFVLVTLFNIILLLLLRSNNIRKVNHVQHISLFFSLLLPLPTTL